MVTRTTGIRGARDTEATAEGWTLVKMALCGADTGDTPRGITTPFIHLGPSLPAEHGAPLLPDRENPL